MSKEFRDRFRAGELLYGTMLTLPSGAVAEILCETGFDWIFVDAEHGPIEATELQLILQTISKRVPCLVRVPTTCSVSIQRALDLGAAGIIVPQVNSAEQADRVVDFSHYPPLGSRGVGISRAHGYGLQFQPYVADANQRSTVIVQVENIKAVEAIESIVKVPGLDGVLIGPYDLSASMGLMGQIEHPKVVEAIDHVTRICQKANLRLGIFGVTSDSVRPYIAKGYTLLVAGVDTIMLGQGARSVLMAMKAK
ncbi:MAG: 2,4-dihydroxyhept-2-ene-1,7-dioic acid aldolase [Planctomycetes bacterium]|nr:2,4-dihydroxyhept-2-ene-1,7-dioic acid aldolase [Planctomycetota bacterium]